MSVLDLHTFTAELVVLFGFGLIGDVVTTFYALQIGLKEGNPVVNFVSKYIPFNVVMIVSHGLVFASLLLLDLEQPWMIEEETAVILLPNPALLFGTIIMLSLTIWNSLQILSAKR